MAGCSRGNRNGCCILVGKPRDYGNICHSSSTYISSGINCVRRCLGSYKCNYDCCGCRWGWRIKFSTKL